MVAATRDRVSRGRKKWTGILGFQVVEVVSLDCVDVSLGVGASVARDRLKDVGTKGRLCSQSIG